jgi:hypothetical protein
VADEQSVGHEAVVEPGSKQLVVIVALDQIDLPAEAALVIDKNETANRPDPGKKMRLGALAPCGA